MFRLHSVFHVKDFLIVCFATSKFTLSFWISLSCVRPFLYKKKKKEERNNKRIYISIYFISWSELSHCVCMCGTACELTPKRILCATSEKCFSFLWHHRNHCRRPCHCCFLIRRFRFGCFASVTGFPLSCDCCRLMCSHLQ